SLGVISCRKESLVALLNRHRELTAKLKSVRYLHVVREYNTVVDSLAGEALESKVPKVVLNDLRKLELKELNRIQEMIYNAVEAETEAEALTDNSRAEAQRTNAEAQHIPNADDIDPVTVQEERRRRISKAQDEEQRWSMLKAILRGETAKTSYKEARDAWKWSDKFVLSSDNLLYYVGPTRSKSEDDQPELLLKLLVPTTMIREVLPNCHEDTKVLVDRIRG
ncbi:hypothetical protein PHMEG_00033619, partial [Phytophthora megakarya]